MSAIDSKARAPRILIVIPAYNEEKSVISVAREALAYFFIFVLFLNRELWI